MLSNDPKRFKRLGIDLRPRWLRRLAVVLTYLVYAGVSIGLHRREAFPSGEMVAWLAWIWVICFSIFGLFSPLKSFHDPSRPAGGRLFAGWKNTVMLGSLDDWAKYKFGDVFDRVTDEQQQELLQTYRVGNYLMPYKSASGFDPRVPDEREWGERNWAVDRTLRFLTFLLIVEAVETAIYETWKFPAGDAFRDLAVIAITLPKAIVLWTEADPRESEEPEAMETA
jgi:hypothetical protein